MAKKKGGQNKDACKAYKLGKKREHNKIKKINRHLKRFPGDLGAVKDLQRVQTFIRG